MMALMAVLGLAVTSCTKENLVEEMNVVAMTHSVVYIVDGRQYYDNPKTEEEWSVFLDRMIALAEEGHSVQFWRNDVQTSSTKEKVTYTTNNYEDAKAWCKQKINEGYNVTMSYDQATGVYTCIAVR